MADQPLNVLLITADELRGDCVGFAGNRDVRTPRLDALADRSTVFPWHFAVHGKCVPSRIALATGRHAHTDGFRAIEEESHLPSGAPCILTALKARGYAAAVFGHNHVWADFWGTNRRSSSIVDWHSYTEDDGIRALLDRSWPPPAPRPGAPQPPELHDGWDYRGRTERVDGFCDDNRAEQAIAFIGRVRDPARPFFLQLNLGKPHPPYAVEEPWFSLHDRARITPFPQRLPTGAPLHLRALRRIRAGDEPDERACREVLATYYGMVAKIDALIGRVVDALDRAGIAERTVLAFTSDHGDFVGQYQLIEKWDTALNDCILRVPMLIRAPGAPPRRVEGLSSHVDIAATLLELAGVPAPAGWHRHGRSLAACVREGAAAGDEVFADGGHEAEMRRRFSAELWRTDPSTGRRERAVSGKQHTYAEVPDAMARAKMVRTARWKLVVRETGGDELYDVANDPWELENLHGRPERLADTADLQQRLLRWCLRTDPDRPVIPRVGA